MSTTNRNSEPAPATGRGIHYTVNGEPDNAAERQEFLDARRCTLRQR